jgi:hypothetical protein
LCLFGLETIVGLLRLLPSSLSIWPWDNCRSSSSSSLITVYLTLRQLQIFFVFFPHHCLFDLETIVGPYGIWKMRFRCLHRGLTLTPKRNLDATVATAGLHDVCMKTIFKCFCEFAVVPYMSVMCCTRPFGDNIWYHIICITDTLYNTIGMQLQN